MAPSELRALAGATIVFDLDGTLVDTAPDLVGVLNRVLVEAGLQPLPFEEGRNLIGGGARALLERGFARLGEPLTEARGDELFARFFALYRERLVHRSRPYPGVPEALAELEEAGAALAVCTNKPTDLSVPLLAQLDLARFFASVMGPDVAGARKPDPRHLLAAIAAAGGDPARAVMVGDSAADADAARAAGVPLVLVSYGYTETPAAQLSPDILIDRFDALPDACVRLLDACSR
jgi:phosphoglycolate phosphatase